MNPAVKAVQTFCEDVVHLSGWNSLLQLMSCRFFHKERLLVENPFFFFFFSGFLAAPVCILLDTRKLPQCR